MTDRQELEALAVSREEYLYLADQQAYARSRYHEEDASLIRESLVIEKALRTASPAAGRDVNDALERAAKIVMKWKADPAIAFEIRELKDSATPGAVAEPSKIAQDIADEFIAVCEAAARQAKRTGNTFVLDRQRTANLIQAKLARLHPAPSDGAIRADQVEWVVNDIAELGVKIGNRFFFLYKGRSLVYGDDEKSRAAGVVLNEDMDPPTPHSWRPVFKREFGECAHPINYNDPTRIGTVSPDDSDEWKPLPAALAAQSPATGDKG